MFPQLIENLVTCYVPNRALGATIMSGTIRCTIWVHFSELLTFVAKGSHIYGKATKWNLSIPWHVNIFQLIGNMKHVNNLFNELTKWFTCYVSQKRRQCDQNRKGKDPKPTFDPRLDPTGMHAWHETERFPGGSHIPNLRYAQTFHWWIYIYIYIYGERLYSERETHSELSHSRKGP